MRYESIVEWSFWRRMKLFHASSVTILWEKYYKLQRNNEQSGISEVKFRKWQVKPIRYTVILKMHWWHDTSNKEVSKLTWYRWLMVWIACLTLGFAQYKNNVTYRYVIKLNLYAYIDFYSFCFVRKWIQILIKVHFLEVIAVWNLES